MVLERRIRMSHWTKFAGSEFEEGKVRNDACFAWRRVDFAYALHIWCKRG